MEYEYLDDANEVADAVRRRGALQAVQEALLAETEAERLVRIRDEEQTTAARRRTATLAVPDAKRNAERFRRKAAKLLERISLDPEELAGIERDALATALRENEREHASRAADIELLEDELETFDDEDDRLRHAELVKMRREELELVELAHDVLLTKRSVLQ